MARKRILIVDDDPAVRKVVERVIRLTMECDMASAESGEAALQLLEQQPFDVIVSDIEMPGMNGVDLLNIVQELHPSTIRLAFSGISDQDLAFKTAQSVHQFLQKPMDLAVLGKKIQQVIDLRRLLPEEGLERVVACIKTLPSLPQSYQELEKELHNRNPSLDRVGQILAGDLAMSAKVLQLVNSAFFGLRERVSTVTQAASLLGLNTLRSLVLAFHVFGSWKNRRVAGFDPNALWNHSLGVSSLVRDIAEQEGLEKGLKEDAQIAGLFHDMGRLILADNLPDSCEAIDTMVRLEGKTSMEAERQVLGATHAETGAYLLALWGFGPSIVDAAAFHHAPRQNAGRKLSAEILVHVANVLDYERSGKTLPGDVHLDLPLLDAMGLKARYLNWRQSAMGAGGATPIQAK